MQISDYPFEDLPFSSLFKTYLNNFDKLSDFYDVNPFDDEAIGHKIKQYSFAGDRVQTVNILNAFNRQFDVDQAAFENIDRLNDEDALTVVTGQQLGIYGGPLYTILKTISTIHLARQLERKFGCPVIPVFWLADEDHDYDEVRSLSILEEDEVQKLTLPARENHIPAVSEMEIPSALKQLRTKLKQSLYNTDFSDDLWNLLDSTFSPEKTFNDAFGHLISKLFSKHGLVLAGSNHPEVKRATESYLKLSIERADHIRQSLEQKSTQIEHNFHQQVKLYDSNLFYLDKEAGRTKISRNGNGWKTDSGIEWKTDQLVKEIDEEPQNFSPNVFLRPILQDALLPTLGYVAGPGETAYYGQMKQMYSCFDLSMPVIFPRLSATLVEPAIDRIMNELPFEFHEYGNRIEDLESDYVDRTEQHDIEAIFTDWKEQIEKLANPKTEEISEIDPTLEGAAGKATAAYYNELDKLKGKVYRAVKQQDQTQLKRIRRIKANLFPESKLQERVLAGIFFMNKYGLDIWDKLLASLKEDEQFDQHKLIYL